MRDVFRMPCLAGVVNHERGLQQIVVTAVGARADQRLVELDPFARDLVGRIRVARAERLGDHRLDIAERQHFIDLEARSVARRDAADTAAPGPPCLVPRVR